MRKQYDHNVLKSYKCNITLAHWDRRQPRMHFYSILITYLTNQLFHHYIILNMQSRYLNFCYNVTFEYIHLRLQIRLIQNSLAYYSYSQFKKQTKKTPKILKTLHCQISMWQECAVDTLRFFGFWFFLPPHGVSLQCFPSSTYVSVWSNFHFCGICSGEWWLEES